MSLGLTRGPGVIQWEHDHQATPLTEETYLGPDFQYSATIERIAGADGTPRAIILLYSKASNVLVECDPIAQTNTTTPVPLPTAIQQAALQILNLLSFVHMPEPNLIAAWIACEGGLPWNNPLNVASPLDGHWAWTGQTGHINNLGNGFGVASFSTLAYGCAANAHVIRQPNMKDILAAITADDPATLVQALHDDPWGTNPDCVKAQLGL